MQIKFVYLWLSFIKNYVLLEDIVSIEHNFNYSSSERQCEDFIHPKLEIVNILSPEYSLKSPNYPREYPSNLDCIVTIKAPNPAMIIKLDFIETFNVEFSKNCINDFLEINDGPFGFSRTIHRFCGNVVPLNSIHSTGQYLWLRFYTDSTLTKTGFRLLYRFEEIGSKKDANKYCYKKVQIPSGHSALLTNEYLTTKLTNSQNSKNISECVFDVQVNEESNIFISTSYTNFSKTKSFNQFIEIYDKFTTKTNTQSKKYYFYIDKNNSFKQRLLTSKRGIFRIVFQDIKSIMKFQFIVTALIKSFEGESCQLNQFKCSNSYCISEKLSCNTHKNCPFNEDEICSTTTIKTVYSVPSTKNNESSLIDFKMHGMILGAIASVLLTMLLICVIHSIKQNKKNKTKVKLIKNNHSFNNLNKERAILVRQSSITTLTTGQSTKKLFNNSNNGSLHFKPKLFQQYPLSIWENNKSCENFTHTLVSDHNKRRSSDSINLENSNVKSTLSIYKVKFENKLIDAHGYNSLPNVNESMKSLNVSASKPFYESINPAPLKPVIKKYYA